MVRLLSANETFIVAKYGYNIYCVFMIQVTHFVKILTWIPAKHD